MAEATIHFSRERADALRYPLYYTCHMMAERFCSAVDGIGDPWKETPPSTAGGKAYANQLRSLLRLLDQLGWDFGEPGKVDQLTTDAELFVMVLSHGRDIALDVLNELSFDEIKRAVDAADLYVELLDQLPVEAEAVTS
jgi:hypothetical protein